MKLTTEQKELIRELTKEFNKYQIEEIVEGIKNGIADVNIYAKPEWNYWKMYQVREMLEAYKDINFRDIDFNLFEAEEIKEISNYLDELDFNLSHLKNKATSTEKANEITKMIQKFIDKKFKGE